MDASATRYAARVSMQSGRQEIIADLKNMVSPWGGGLGGRAALRCSRVLAGGARAARVLLARCSP